MGVLDTPAINPRLVRPLPAIAFFGDSYTYGLEANTLPRSAVDVATTDRNLRYPTLVGARLGTEPRNFGLSGTSSPATSGGGGQLSRVLREITPLWTPPFSAVYPVVVLRLSWNDWGLTGMTTTLQTDNVRAMIHRARAGAVLHVNSAAFVMAQGAGGTGWSTNAAFEGVSGRVIKWATANGNTWTLTLPSDFPGGTLRLAGIRDNNSGSVHTITVDGGAYGTWDTRLTNTQANYNATAYSITGLAAGAHTIVGTIGNIVNSVDYFNYCQIDAPNPPLVVVMLINKMTTYPAGQTDTQVDNANTAISAMIASDFTDGKVVTIDTNTVLGNKAAAYYNNVSGGDGWHPSMRGHSAIADAVVASIRANMPAPATVDTMRAAPRNQLSGLEILSTGISPRIGAATLVGGTVTVTSFAFNSFTKVFLNRKTLGGTAGNLSYALTAASGTTAGNIVITSSSGTDTSVIEWLAVDAV